MKRIARRRGLGGGTRARRGAGVLPLSSGRVTRVRVVFACLVALSAGLAGCSLGNNNGGGSGVPPQVGAKSSDTKAAAKLGFPQTATKDTVRVSGGDAISDV